jgi:hypothetical protein
MIMYKAWNNYLLSTLFLSNITWNNFSFAPVGYKDTPIRAQMWRHSHNEDLGYILVENIVLITEDELGNVSHLFSFSRL